MWARSGLAICLRLSGFVALFSSLGCASIPQRGASARQQLLDAMKPFEANGFVELTGKIRKSSDSAPKSFLLLMGPDGRFLYRCGDTLQFSNGYTRGSIDFSTFPRTEQVTHEGVDREDVAMAVGMAEGPYPFALAYALGHERWLSALLGPKGGEFESSNRLRDDLDIVIRQEGRELRFIFVGGNKRPSVYRVRACGDKVHLDEIENRFSIVRFPNQIPDKAFRPDLASQAGQAEKE